jgi:hypothetical protein
MRVYLLRGPVTPNKRALESLITGDSESRLVCFAPTTLSLEEAKSVRRIKFLRLICAKAPVIVVSDYLSTRDECDEFIISATDQGYEVTSIVVESLSPNPRLVTCQPMARLFEIQLHHENVVQNTTDRVTHPNGQSE